MSTLTTNTLPPIEVGDELALREYRGYGGRGWVSIATVERVTATQAVLDNGVRVWRSGPHWRRGRDIHEKRQLHKWDTWQPATDEDRGDYARQPS